jgi:hypothetical protein
MKKKDEKKKEKRKKKKKKNLKEIRIFYENMKLLILALLD